MFPAQVKHKSEEISELYLHRLINAKYLII